MQIRFIERHSNRSGITLIDLTVTILIIGILAGITAPRFAESMNYYEADSAAKRLANDLQMARKYAIDKSREQRIRLNQNTNSYSITTLEDPDLPGNRYTVELDEHPYQSRLSKMSFNPRDNIIFNIHGQINFSGEIQVTSGNSSKVISFDAETGEVSVQ